MAECAVARCAQERRFVRKELQRWGKNLLFLVGKWTPGLRGQRERRDGLARRYASCRALLRSRSPALCGQIDRQRDVVVEPVPVTRPTHTHTPSPFVSTLDRRASCHRHCATSACYRAVRRRDEFFRLELEPSSGPRLEKVALPRDAPYERFARARAHSTLARSYLFVYFACRCSYRCT